MTTYTKSRLRNMISNSKYRLTAIFIYSRYYNIYYLLLGPLFFFFLSWHGNPKSSHFLIYFSSITVSQKCTIVSWDESQMPQKRHLPQWCIHRYLYLACFYPVVSVSYKTALNIYIKKEDFSYLCQDDQ